MQMTLNKSLKLAANGNWDAAWDLAQQDEGINNCVTFEDWKEFATKAIARRAAEAKTHATM